MYLHPDRAVPVHTSHTHRSETRPELCAAADCVKRRDTPPALAALRREIIRAVQKCAPRPHACRLHTFSCWTPPPASLTQWASPRPVCAASKPVTYGQLTVAATADMKPNNQMSELDCLRTRTTPSLQIIPTTVLHDPSAVRPG